LGIAHLGVIKVLQENQIPIHYIAGVSAGAIVGAFLAAGYKWDEMMKLVKELNWGRIARPTIPKKGILDGKLLQRFIEQRLGKLDFSDLSIPFAAVAVDITTGKEVVMDQGSVSQAVRASCSIPGIFTPLEKDGNVYVNGGLKNFLPVDVVRRMGADYVIAVKLVPSFKSKQKPDNIFQILLNSFVFLLQGISDEATSGDVNILPDLEGMNFYDFSQAEELLERGIAAAQRRIPQIKTHLRL